MNKVPWSYLESWQCYGCGDICCSSSIVPLTVSEWVRMFQNYGSGITETTLSGFYLRKTCDNRCVFQYDYGGRSLCAIQHMKPTACKIWPFRICRKPQYGLAKEASYKFGSNIFYIYVDTACRGVKSGVPSLSLTEKLIPEFIELYFGINNKQLYTTGNVESLRRLKDWGFRQFD